MQEPVEDKNGLSGSTTNESNQNRYRSIISRMDAVAKFSDEWFHLKEQEISLRNILDAAEDVEPTSDALGANLDVAEDSAHHGRVLCGRPEVLTDVDAPVPKFAAILRPEKNARPSTTNTGEHHRAHHVRPEIIECGSQSSAPLPSVHQVVGRDTQVEKKFTGSTGYSTSRPEIIEHSQAPRAELMDHCRDIKVKGKLRTDDVPTTLINGPTVFVDSNEVPVPPSCIQQKSGVQSITGKREARMVPVLDENEDMQSPFRHSSSHSINKDKGSTKSCHSSDRGLVVACPIIEDEPVYMASEYDPSPTTSRYKNTRCRIYTLLVLLVVGPGIIVGIVYATTDGLTKESRREASVRRIIEENILERNASFSSMSNVDPRYLALEWILHDDRMQLSATDSNLDQRYILATLAFSFELYSWWCGMIYDNDYCNTTDDQVDYDLWLSETDECSWFGVECDHNGTITELDLCKCCVNYSYNWLVSSFLPTANYYVSILDHAVDNNLIGEIPPEIAGLRYLNSLRMGENCIYSTLPPEMFALNLTELDVGWNVHSGSVPSEIYKLGSLTRLNLAGNRRYGSCNRTDGTSADFSSNGLEGNILASDIGNLTELTEFEVYRNSFDGPISAQIRMMNNLGM